MPIEQKQIKADGNTARKLLGIRGKFEEVLGQPNSYTFLLLQKWLQAPVGVSGKADNNCMQRAAQLAPLLNQSAELPYKPNLTAKPFGESSYQKKWELIDAALTKNRVVILEGPADMVGGPRSVFTTGFHVIVLLSFIDREKRPCYIGFDPDTSATEASRNLWTELVEECQTDNNGVKNLQPVQLHRLVKTMILGAGNEGVGPLIRKYYPNRDEGLGVINRNLAF